MGTFKPASREINIKDFEVISEAKEKISPSPRHPFNVLDKKWVNLRLRKIHLYLRNEKIAALFRLRNHLLQNLHTFFQTRGFTEFTAPILTPITLYGKDTAFSINFYGKTLYLTQCTAFYLEAALHVFKKVYFISPSFRAEKSKSKRHLSEYWHLKAEIAFFDLNNIINFVEEMIQVSYKDLIRRGEKELGKLGVEKRYKFFKPPYKRITYEEALQILKEGGLQIDWGKSLGHDEEVFLGKIFQRPFWITYLPRSIEPFPYRINPSDERTTLTADLIIPPYGEVLGVAEKIYEEEELEKRMREDFVPHSLDTYKWYMELRKFGMPPHSGFGVGIERILRSYLNLDHVRDCIPFPRMYRRSPYP